MMEVAQNDFEMALSGELIQQAQAYFVIVTFYRSFEACHNELGLLVQTQIMKRVDECYAAMRILIASFQLTCNSISPLFRFLFSVFSRLCMCFLSILLINRLRASMSDEIMPFMSRALELNRLTVITVLYKKLEQHKMQK